MMEIQYSEKAVKQLRKICMSDKKSARLIINRIEAYANNPSRHFDIKLLKGKFEDLKRLRVGDYRIIFDEDNHVLFIYEIKHRQEAYL